MADRIILHCDCNSFFASVETLLNPHYKNVPMAVCGSVEDRHGIVLAKNEIAKQYGIITAETVYSAKRKCRNLVIAAPHYEEYLEISKKVNNIYKEYTDLVEPFGIDESWLDVTASTKIFGSGSEIAENIRKRVREEIGITVSIGVSFNKVFSKLGSDYKKPDAVTIISRENFKEIVYPLSVSDLLFVGKKTAQVLRKSGIKTIGALANAAPETLVALFGKNGTMLHDYANGNENSPVNSCKEEQKSISNGFTFKHDIVDFDECRVAIDFLSEEIGSKLRSLGKLCSTVSITVKDASLRSIQRQASQNPPTDIAREIANTAFSILQSEWMTERPIRMLTVTASNLFDKNFEVKQIDVFDSEIYDNHRLKSKKKEHAVDSIKKRFGNFSIVNGALINTDLGIYDKKK